MAQAKIKMIPGKRAGKTAVPTLTAPQKTSASFVVGAPVKLSSGVWVAASTANGASSTTTYVKKSSTSNVVGISMGRARASVTRDVAVALVQEGMEFIGNLVHKTAASAKVSKIGSTVYLGKDKSSDTHYGWSLSAPGASSTSYIYGKINRLIDAASTVNGRVSVQIVKGGALSAF